MATLTGTKISDTYEQLIKLDTETLGADASAKWLETGKAENLPIAVSTTRVGIGTTAPAEELEVEATDDSTIKIESTASNSRAILMLKNDAQQWVVDVEGAVTDNFRIRNGTTGSTKLSIMPSGNIGIGWDAPTHKLVVRGDADQIRLNSADYNLISLENRGSGGDLDKALIRMYAAGAAKVALDTAGDSYFIGGQFGLGTATPDFNLDIEANLDGDLSHIQLTNTHNTDDLDDSVSIRFSPDSRQLNSARIRCGKQEDYASSAAHSAYLAFHTTNNNSSAEKMRIASTGNVGIGLTDPAYPLEVHDDTDNGYVGYFEQNHGTGWGIGIQLGAEGVSANEFYIKFIDNADNIEGSISGNASNPGIDVNGTSDRRLKENIVTIPDAMSIISKIKPRSFDWKKTGSSAYGFIADEWFDVFPDSVIGQRDSDGNLIPDAMTTVVIPAIEAVAAVAAIDAVLDGDGNIIEEAVVAVEAVEAIPEGTKEVIDRQLMGTKDVIPVLVKAIQELSAKIVALETKDTEYATTITALTARITALESA